MGFTLRTKLLAIGVTISLAFGVLLTTSAIISARLDDELNRVQQLYLPKLEAGPRLEHAFEQLSRAMQDAVAAHDRELLAQTHALEVELLRNIADTKTGMTADDVKDVSGALDNFDRVARDLSRRLIGGETGEQLSDDIERMQSARTAALESIRRATRLERGELNAAFGNVAQAQATAARVRLLVSLGCMALVLLLLAWLSSGLLKSVSDLGHGLERFGTGRFEQRIELRTNDEFGALAGRANEMAANLARMEEERRKAAWLREGVSGLMSDVRGELGTAEVARRALSYLARYLKAPTGVIYAANGAAGLSLIASYGADSAPEQFEIGKGLVGEAAVSHDMVVIESPPTGVLALRSGLASGTPRALVLLPLFHANAVSGVLELGVIGEWTDLHAELLRLVRSTIAISLEVAQARDRARTLLAETQAQAARLRSQEEELRSNNEELQAQQEELRQANEELTNQAAELEAQRHALEGKNGELEAVRISLERQTKELATVSSYKSQFLTNMSHELRTPLNAMLLLSQLLAENDSGNLTEKEVEHCKTINSAGKDLLALINQVLDLAKVESGTQELRIETVALEDVVSRVDRVFSAMAQRQGLLLTVRREEPLPKTIETDRQRLDQILTNLVGNALKFTAKGSVAVGVALAKPANPGSDTRLVFTVTDTGTGIRPEDQQRIFVPFEQVSSAQGPKGGGTGLGLPIAAELAQLLGGELRLLSSAPGAGSSFALFLPLRKTAATRAAPEPVALEHNAAPGAPAEKRPLLLLIEDDRAFGRAFGEIVESLGFDFLVAGDGTAGLALANLKRPQGILLDVKLPDMNGFEVMERLREDPVTRQIPVHFVSAVQGGERAAALGAVGYLTKPASEVELRRVAELLVSRAHRDTSRVLVVEDDQMTSDSLLENLRTEGIDAVGASDAKQALAELAAHQIAGVILDLSLPDMDGLELLDRIRQSYGTRIPSVIVYTARSLSRAETQRLEAYADAIVLKEGNSVERLMNEVRLFTRRLHERLGSRSSPPAVSDTSINLAGKRVLVVDDDMRTVYGLSAMLRAKGAEVVVASNGRAAFNELSRQEHFDVVLMDIMMPEMDGYEAMRAIRNEKRFEALPIIALTAKAMKDDEQKCLDAGATAYLPKPVDGGRLFAIIREHLR